MNTPVKKHKPKDQLLSEPVKLQSDHAYSDIMGGEPKEKAGLENPRPNEILS